MAVASCRRTSPLFWLRVSAMDGTELECRWRRPDGQVRWLRMQVRSLGGGGWKPRGVGRGAGRDR